MTAKEQAIELFNKFLYIDDTDYQIENCCGITLYQVKQCAIIAVNEIIEELESERVFERLDFWNEVKAEIEKL